MLFFDIYLTCAAMQWWHCDVTFSWLTSWACFWNGRCYDMISTTTTRT